MSLLREVLDRAGKRRHQRDDREQTGDNGRAARRADGLTAHARAVDGLALTIGARLRSGTIDGIFVASRVFVAQLEHLGPMLGLRPQLLALLLSPIATELPETMNAIIWVRQGKHRLAPANISGAMMIQATIPTAFGLFFTPWMLSPPLLMAAGVAVISVSMMYFAFRADRISRRMLVAMSSLYAAFVVVLLTIPIRTGV